MKQIISFTTIVIMIMCSTNIACAQNDGGKVRLRMIHLQSDAFKKDNMIPKEYTCDGASVSPRLIWDSLPNVRSYALTCIDPDAPSGSWVHWVVYNMPPTTNELPKHVPMIETLADGSKQGITDFRTVGYGGPCPPGGTHRYVFRVYALDTVLQFPVGTKVTSAVLIRAMKDHMIGMGELIGRYGR